MDLSINSTEQTNDQKGHLKSVYGAEFIEPGQSKIITATIDDLYFYTTYIGSHTVNIEQGDCVYYISKDKKTAHLARGSTEIQTRHVATVIRGYMPEDKTSTIVTRTNLPYVNGCSTKQVFPPDRLGDPTLQLLDIPPFSAEQAHHIHSTVRVAYILKGTGTCIIGMDKKYLVEKLYPGKVCILYKMCPHHFETDDEHLIVLPLHVFSSIGSAEHNHPMYNGTHMTN